MYSWTLLTRKPADPAYRVGVTDDLARTQREAEPYLESGKAFVCRIEKVRFTMTADLSSSYAPVGLYWIGRLNSRGRVTWSEHWGYPVAIRKVPAVPEPTTPVIDVSHPGRPGPSRNHATRTSRV